jgi:uncharacterized membrane protein YdbT with pleckstrin-like domain
LGVILALFTVKEKVKGNLRAFLLITGISSSGLFVGVLLHNLLYALVIMTKQIVLLSNIFEVFSTIFFIAAVILCPIAFLIGIVGTLFNYKK